MSQSRTRFIGRDVQKETRAVAYVAHEQGAAVTSCGTIGTRQSDRDTLRRPMPSNAHHLLFLDAAGPCGSWLSRSLQQQDDACGVVAPSRMPTKAGERGTTDRRDAVPLARLARSGALTLVDGPTVDDEALRALTRARAETMSARKDATCRRNAFVRRQAIRSAGRAKWGPAHLRWLSAGVCPPPGAAPRLSRRRPCRPCAPRAPRASGTRTPSARPIVALAARGGRPPGPAGGAVHRGQHHGGGHGCPDALRQPQRTEAMPGGGPCSICRWRAAPAGDDDENRQPPCPTRAGRRRLGVPLSRAGQPTVATAPRQPPHKPSGPPVEGARQAVHTLPTTGGHGHTCSWRDGGHGACAGRLRVGHGQGGSRHTVKTQRPLARPLPRARRPAQVGQRALEETQPRCGVTLGGVKRPHGHPRPSMEAGTRRRHGRWDPTHGEQQDQPSSLPGSGSSDARRLQNSRKTSKKLLPTLDIGSHSNASLQLLPEAGATHERMLFLVALQVLVHRGKGRTPMHHLE
jgi:hypothetical protein